MTGQECQGGCSIVGQRAPGSSCRKATSGAHMLDLESEPAKRAQAASTLEGAPVAGSVLPALRPKRGFGGGGVARIASLQTTAARLWLLGRALLLLPCRWNGTVEPWRARQYEILLGQDHASRILGTRVRVRELT